MLKFPVDRLTRGRDAGSVLLHVRLFLPGRQGIYFNQYCLKQYMERMLLHVT